MSKVKVRFFDDEVLEGEARDLDLDEPDFILEIQDASGLENSELAWIPLTAVKFVELPETEPESHTKKVAIRFLDGEVLRGWVGGEVVRHRYGVALHLHPEKPNGDGSGNGASVTAGALSAGGGSVATATRTVSDRDKIGRNDPCWCGSGKKFKKCHGA